MPLYTFHLCDDGGNPYTFEAFERSQDSEAYQAAGVLLKQHPHALFVAVWASERPVLSRYREKPFIRAVQPTDTCQVSA